MDKPDKEKIATDVKKLNFRDAQARREELLGLANEFYKEIGDQAATSDQVEYVETINKTVEELEHHIKAQGDFEALRTRQTAAYGAGGGGGNNGAPQAPGQMEEPVKAKGAAQIILENPEFKSWFEKKTDDGRGGRRPLADSDSVMGSPAIPFNKKDLVTDAMLTTGTLVRPDYRPLVDLGWPKLVLRDLMSVGTTKNPVVTYPRVNLRTNNAAVVPEATATSGSSGTKPESAWRIAPVTANVQTIAHWIPVTKTALSDAGELELLLNNFLLMGLDQKVEEELLIGAGGSTHLLGLTNQTGILGQPFTTDMLTTTRRARTRVEDVGNRVPNGYLFNPDDWCTIELTTAPGSGVYYYGGPAVLGPPRLWGLPVVTSHFQPKGSGYCADFKQYALWDREQGNIKMTDGYMDFFIRNMVVILAEMRLANGILDANGICQMDLFSGPNS